MFLYEGIFRDRKEKNLTLGVMLLEKKHEKIWQRKVKFLWKVAVDLAVGEKGRKKSFRE